LHQDFHKSRLVPRETGEDLGGGKGKIERKQIPAKKAEGAGHRSPCTGASRHLGEGWGKVEARREEPGRKGERALEGASLLGGEKH